MSIKKVIEPESVRGSGNNDKFEEIKGRERIHPFPFLIRMRMVFIFICFMLLLVGMLSLFCIDEAEAVTITVNPGESVQDAIDSLPPEGGIVELLPGVHDVNDTIILNRSNVAIQGTHDSEIRSHNSSKDIFNINVPWTGQSMLENITFDGFKVTSTYVYEWPYHTNSLIRANNVNNLTVEGLDDSSFIRGFLGLNGGPPRGQVTSEGLRILNNTIQKSVISFVFCKNATVAYNTITGRSHSTYAIAPSPGNDYVAIHDNYIDDAGSTANIRTESLYSHIYNNTCKGSRIGISVRAMADNVRVENNTITGTTMEAQSGIELKSQYGLDNITVTNNRIYNCRGHGIEVGDYGYGMSGSSDVDITNNVIFNNGGDGIRRRHAVNKTSFPWMATITNNIIANNAGYGINFTGENTTETHIYNNIWNNTAENYCSTSAGTGDISVNPLFADSANGDFHLKSTEGRWNGSEWVIDDEDSPCIDAGDPASDYSNEPEPNGGRINMGAYGNTGEASKSPPPTITSFYPPSSSVSDVEGKTRTFNITVDQVVNVTWLINGTQVQPINESVTEASYTNVSAKVGTWNVSAIATSVTTGLSAMQTWIWIVRSAEFDTGPRTYPSIFGTHRGTITPVHDVYISKMYTYPCAGTGGHSEYVKFYNDSWSIEANWNGYQGSDYHFITFDEQFTLEAEITYNYTIRTGSYPQIHHNTTLTVPDGEITCTKFTDANGRVYYDWIPAFRLFL